MNLGDAERHAALEGIRDSLHRIRDIVRHIGNLREVHTKDYLPGIRMVDLEGSAPAAPPVFRGMALIMVPDEDLARVVALLLRGAGFGVERCADAEALDRSAGRPAIVLVLVVGGSDAAGAHALGGFTPPGERGYRVVALSAANPSAALEAGADQVIEVPFDPVGFTAEMIRLAP